MVEVSIIIPTYKPNNYLFECIDCLLKQTIDSSLFEIIVVLNGPKSPYYLQIVNFIQKINKVTIKLIHIEENGVSLARNKGIELATGKYLGFIDDDDLVSFNYIESLVLNSRPNSIVCSNVRTFEENINEYGLDYLSRSFQKNKLENKTSLFYCRSFLSTVCAKLIPSEVIKNRYFNSKFGIGEDALYMALISDRIQNVWFASEDVIYYRRIRDESMSRKKRNFIFEIKNTLKLMWQYFKIYLESPFKYILLFFVTRELAVLKDFVHRIRR